MGKLQNTKNVIEDAKKFFHEELWTRDISTISSLKRSLFSLCRIIMIVIRGFQQDACSLQASALTYITLVSLVPMLAIMFSFSKGIGMQKKLLDTVGLKCEHVLNEKGEHSLKYSIIQAEAPLVEDEGQKNAPQNTFQAASDGPLAAKLPPPMQEALVKIFEYVENTSFAALGLIGSLMLLFSVVCSMAKLENSMNQIWGVKEARPFIRKCSEYLVVLILIPFVFLLATSANTLLLSNKFVTYLQENYGPVAATLQALVRLMGMLFILLAFGFFYMFMPNTKVKAFPGLMAGCITGILWFGVQWAYLSLQVGLTRANSIYGTFAVVPFFLAWLYANWSIILFGAEVSFAIQNHKTIHIEKASESASTGICIILGELILYETSKAFHSGAHGWSPMNFGLDKSIPSRFIQHVVNVLVKASILTKIKSDNTVEGDLYMPARDISTLSPADIEEAFRNNQSLDTKIYLNELPMQLRERYIQNYQTFYSALSEMTFDKLIEEKTLENEK